ncbi:MAG: DUF4838 domain-containing protein [Limisphaerales bacterium]
MNRLFLLLMLALPLGAAEVKLLDEGKAVHQIVLPNASDSPAVAEGLRQTARLVQTAFLANGAEVGIVSESQRDPAKPGLWLGDTRFARAQGVEVAKLRDWSYVQRVVGRDVILAGHDHAAHGVAEHRSRPSWDRFGTAKAVVDFARQFMGVRFLYPDLPGYTPVSAAAKVDLLASPAIEFLPLKTMAVPADLNVSKTPLLRVNTSHPAGGGFYDLAQNRFPRVDELFGGHTWERAVPAELFESHPEYFTLVNGQRTKLGGNGAQYCLANPDVQERIYRDLASWFERGYTSVDLGQPDGFVACQCAQCDALYGTGKDWSEKIWIFNRTVAERLEKSHPGRQLVMMSYILTAQPPKSFRKFPANTSIMLTGTNEEDFAPWRGVEVPRGFTGYVYNWCPNLATRYTPMRTPGYLETQVKRLAANRIQSLYRDGPGQLFGLEGPVYYVMGRMFDDPERNAAKDLLPEFYEAAFGNKSAAFYMRSFYEQLYHAINLYSDHLGTRADAWTYQPLPGEGRPRKTVLDPFQMMSFLYPPNLFVALEADLKQAEQAATTAKAKTRLALVRREFEYLRHFARVVHLHQAYQVVPDASSRDRLLDAIEARNTFITGLYDARGNPAGPGNWAQVLFPYPGHDAKHLRLAHDGYQEPYANTCFNWDTQAMRSAPNPGKKNIVVASASAPPTLDAPQWQQAAAQELTFIPPLTAKPRKTTLRLLHDAANLYLRVECELEDDAPPEFPAFNRDRVLTGQEAFDIYLQPQASREVFYRFMAGANSGSRYDAANGFITNAMDPRHGTDDPTWNGEWRSEARVDAKTRRWHALVTIPFKTLGVDAPAKGMTWRGNFARYHLLPRNKVDYSVWSSLPGSTSIEDRSLFGELAFD